MLIAGAVLRGILHAAPEAPPDPPLRIDLAPGTLEQTLAHLAERTGLQILYAPDLLQGLTSRGLHGVMTPAEALQQLLALTDLSFEFTARDAVALHNGKKPDAPVAPAPTQPRTITITADRDRADDSRASASLTSVGIDESSLVVPIASSSVTQGTLRDQQVTRLEDALEYVSATEIVPDGRSSSGFEIRGFPTYEYYLDGIRVSPDLHDDGFRDLTNIDHIDVTKGPASLLYGRTEPGGLVNVVTKQPLASPMVSIEQRTGSFGRADTLLDAGGPLSPAGSLLYRLNAAWESDGSFRQVPDSHRIFLAPVLTWKLSQGNETTAYLEYLNSHDPVDSGLPIIGNRLPTVPLDRSLDEGGMVHTTDLRIGVRGSYSVLDGWTLHHHLDARWLRTPQAPQAGLAADGLDSNQCSTSNCPVARLLTAVPVSRGYTAYASVDLSRDIQAWGTRHSLLAGAEYFQTASYSQLEVTSDPSLTTDLFHPINGTIPLSFLQDPQQETYRNARERWEAAYIQDQVSYGDEFYLLVGLRFDSAWASVVQNLSGSLENSSYSGPEESGLQIQIVKHREGFVWHPRPSLSFYALHAENFGATPGLTYPAQGYAGVGDLPAQSATEWETGVKFEPAGGRFAATLAAFELKKEDITSPILQPALDPSGVLFFIGAARNQGLELDIHGEILPNFQYLANYAYIDSRILFGYAGYATSVNGSEQVGNNGNRFFGAPRNGGSAWLSYEFSNSLAHGLKFGTGVVARGAREGDNANDYELPGFVKWNAFAAYGWRVAATQLSVQLNVDNLLNAHYFESLNGTRTVMPAAPRLWIASFRVQF